MGRERYLVGLERRDQEPVLEGYNQVEPDQLAGVLFGEAAQLYAAEAGPSC